MKNRMVIARCNELRMASPFAHMFVACRFVRRRYNPLTGDVSIAGVDEQHGVQTAAGDLLFLKGNAFPGLYGRCGKIFALASLLL